ncbi:hypothetical protein PCANC_11651 [Puccinia coronata f. sp. avenae]|uniref:Uncharacterized protein n=1 Tax=Puccinia coronata f. sp. avenae TaxID=200324 RepID=A0A2N5VXJ5_9BASI|nr:hypothetical protein PCANC_25483 [Puccinia coronata f. sp. avenae]PLW54700.1 hypothetical protein PCANC_11651 [Puccinia coronata f. sp. avenae]
MRCSVVYHVLSLPISAFLTAATAPELIEGISETNTATLVPSTEVRAPGAFNQEPQPYPRFKALSSFSGIMPENVRWGIRPRPRAQSRGNTTKGTHLGTITQSVMDY